jgi:hypothetical protein
MFLPSFTPRGEHSLLFRRMEGQTENFTPGENFTLGGEIHPWGTTSPPRDKAFLPIGAKLRRGLSATDIDLTSFTKLDSNKNGATKMDLNKNGFEQKWI